MPPPWLNAIVYFCAAVVAADLTAVAVATILTPLLAPGRNDLESLKMIAALGAFFAFPVIVVMGLIMIRIGRFLGPADRTVYWAMAGAVGAVPGIILAEGRRLPTPGVVFWVGTSAIAGALVFRLVWRARRSEKSAQVPET